MTIGDIRMAQGDLSGALEAYGRSLELSQRLAELEPSNADWQSSLSVSLLKNGDVCIAQGDLSGAHEAYCQSLELGQRLVELDPSNADWQDSLSVAYERIGLINMALGRTMDAIEAFEQRYQLVQSLAECDSSNMRWQRDLSEVEREIANGRLAEGDREGALSQYFRTLPVKELLAFHDNASSQRDLIAAHLVLEERRHIEEDAVSLALKHYEKALSILETMSERGLLAQNDNWMVRDLKTRLSCLAGEPT